MKVGIAEPRRFCATTLARRVAEEQGCKIGTTVGYCIRFDDCHDPKLTKIKVCNCAPFNSIYVFIFQLPLNFELHFQYMTEGILIREMMADPLLRDYSVIILDEVHERNILTDILMGLLKKIMRVRLFSSVVKI